MNRGKPVATGVPSVVGHGVGKSCRRIEGQSSGISSDRHAGATVPNGGRGLDRGRPAVKDASLTATPLARKYGRARLGHRWPSFRATPSPSCSRTSKGRRGCWTSSVRRLPRGAGEHRRVLREVFGRARRLRGRLRGRRVLLRLPGCGGRRRCRCEAQAALADGLRPGPDGPAHRDAAARSAEVRRERRPSRRPDHEPRVTAGRSFCRRRHATCWTGSCATSASTG